MKKITKLIDDELLNDNQDISKIKIIDNIQKLFLNDQDRLNFKFHLWATENPLSRIFVTLEKENFEDIIDITFYFETKKCHIIHNNKEDNSNHLFIGMLCQHIEPYYLFAAVDKIPEFDNHLFLIKDKVVEELIGGFLGQWPKHLKYIKQNPILDIENFDSLPSTMDNIKFNLSPTSNVGVINL